MNTMAETIRDALKKAKESKPSVQNTKIWDYEPTNRECAAIPCAYLGVSSDLETQIYCKPKKNACAALPNQYDPHF
ncbi:MAG: hypothetical protein KJ955_07200 [Nanoarchaeota archaeon]|nr:hypothetical protein [Nanoarchaeota archaeon]